jgi:hypothetical protein
MALEGNKNRIRGKRERREKCIFTRFQFITSGNVMPSEEGGKELKALFLHVSLNKCIHILHAVFRRWQQSERNQV